MLRKSGSLPTPAPENILNREYYRPSTTNDAGDVDVEFPAMRSGSSSPRSLGTFPHSPLSSSASSLLSPSNSQTFLAQVDTAQLSPKQRLNQKEQHPPKPQPQPKRKRTQAALAALRAPSPPQPTVQLHPHTVLADTDGFVRIGSCERATRSASDSPGLSPVDVLLAADLRDVVALGALETEMCARGVRGRERVSALLGLEQRREVVRKDEEGK